MHFPFIFAKLQTKEQNMNLTLKIHRILPLKENETSGNRKRTLYF